MLYNWIKIFHIITAALLFGTGLGTAAYLLFAALKKDLKILVSETKHVVIADWLFTTVAGILQPISGFAMVTIKGYSLNEFWILASLLGYVIAGICWLPVVHLQIKMHHIAEHALENHQHLPAQYFYYFNRWFILGWPAFGCFIVIFYLMTNRPVSLY